MKAVKITLAGVTLSLAFNGEAMFQIRDDFGSVSALLEMVGQDTREGFAATCRAVALLAEQGELARRFYGYEPERIVTAEEIERLTMPSDMVEMRRAIPQAISLGFGREVQPENNEIDLGLAELNQKKTT